MQSRYTKNISETHKVIKNEFIVGERMQKKSVWDLKKNTATEPLKILFESDLFLN